MADLSVGTIRNIELGETQPWSSSISKLEKALGLSYGTVSEDTKPDAEESDLPFGPLRPFDPHHDGELPAEPGVYMLFSADEHPVYVGRSDNIKKRMQNHQEKFWFRSPVVERGKFVRVDDKEIRKRMESLLIIVIGEKNLIINKTTEKAAEAE